MASMKGFHALRHLPEEKITDKITRRLLVGDKEMVVWWSMKAGAHAAAHKHPHEQVFWVLKGKMEFRLGDDKRACGPGDVGVIPGGVEHERSEERRVGKECRSRWRQDQGHKKNVSKALCPRK